MGALYLADKHFEITVPNTRLETFGMIKYSLDYVQEKHP
jgi:hypothetical protein